MAGNYTKYRVPNASGFIVKGPNVKRSTPAPKIAKGGDLRSRPGNSGGGARATNRD